MKPYLKAALGGYLLCDALNSLNQDMIGKEKYIQICSVAWTTPWVTVPLALVVLFVAFGLICDARDNIK